MTNRITEPEITPSPRHVAIIGGRDAEVGVQLLLWVPLGSVGGKDHQALARGQDQVGEGPLERLGLVVRDAVVQQVY